MPEPVRHYLDHVSGGESIREIARRTGAHPSTVLRRVRRYEARRDDPLVDTALDRLAGDRVDPSANRAERRQDGMDQTPSRQTVSPSGDARFETEARRVLRRLSATGACLAVGAGMDMAVIVRETEDGTTERTGVVETCFAEDMALRDWIQRSGTGRVARYRITARGRAALGDLLAAQENRAGQRNDGALPASGPVSGRGARYSTTDTPIAMLARRRDKGGARYLTPAHVRAAERLREDVAVAEAADGTAIDWDAAMTQTEPVARQTGRGAQAARSRAEAALADLGPGLGDVVYRVACRLDGLETVERRMGWAARSGKVVLVVGLDRLCRHYDTHSADDMIG